MPDEALWSNQLHELDRSAWKLAAVVAALRDREPAAMAVLEEMGLSGDISPAEAEHFVIRATAPLLQAGRFVSGGSTWDDQDDAALLAQGTASAPIGATFADGVLSQLSGGEALQSRPVRFLDVGVGVGSLSIALCRELPQMSVLGLDVLERALELARRQVADAELDERIELQLLDVAELEIEAEFDLAWLPAPFIPPAIIRVGVRRVAQALREGGWLLLAHGRLEGEPLDAAVTRFKTMAYGGTALDDREAESLLSDAGLSDARHLSMPPGAPSVAVARKA